jgi:hypothetical protein
LLLSVETFMLERLSTESGGLSMRMSLEQAIAALEAAETLSLKFKELIALERRIAAHPARTLKRHRRKPARGRIARP